MTPTATAATPAAESAQALAPNAARSRAAGRGSLLLLIAALAVGTGLRLDQFLAQVLIDDEWHAVHQVIASAPARMFVEFGHADYSIPLGLLYWLLATGPGLSEAAMRAPMLACGLAVLVVFPLYVARRLTWPVAAVFAVLLATSPLLVLYSRIARPYAITLLLVWVAHAAFLRFHASHGHFRSGALYVAAAALATWLHPIVGPFVVAPFFWGLAKAVQLPAGSRRPALFRLLALGLASGAAIAALVLPPLLANPQSLARKSGIHAPNLATIAGVWNAWFGTPHVAVVALCFVLAALGARDLWRALPVARTGALGIALMFAALLVTKPEHSVNPITTGRYLLPIVPLLLLSMAVGLVRLAGVGTRGSGRRAVLRPLVAVVAGTSLIVLSPAWSQLRRPNGHSLELRQYFDFRPGHNLVQQSMAGIPLSPFWRTQAASDRGSLTFAVAPFHFESYFWDASRWERESRQTVIPAWLNGFCIDARLGEVPSSPAFRFRNAVHVADDDGLRRRGVDFVVWQKPFAIPLAANLYHYERETAHCVDGLRAHFGPPAFEDDHIVVFRVPGISGTPTGDRRGN